MPETRSEEAKKYYRSDRLPRYASHMPIMVLTALVLLVFSTLSTYLILGMSGNAAYVTALMIMCSMYPAGDAYEYLCERMPRFVQKHSDIDATARLILYMALVPLFPLHMILLLNYIELPGLNYAMHVHGGAWAAGVSLSVWFGSLRLCQMPTSCRALVDLVARSRPSKKQLR